MDPLKVLDPNALNARQPVWVALSDMFLDTDTSLSREWRAKQLAHSPYSVAEIEAILVEEVYPVCRANLLLVAGEWSGFDPEWLQSKILARKRSRWRALHGLNIGRFTVRKWAEWQATKVALVSIRSAAASAA